MPVETSATSASRDAILDAAEALFAQRGFTASTIKQIGERARSNPALLYYYFGSKELLYGQVLERLADRLLSHFSSELERARSPDDVVRAVVRAQADFLRANPRAPALIVRELLDHDARHADAFVARVAPVLFRRLTEAIEAGKRTGRYRADVDARFAAVSTIAQVVYFHLVSPAFRAVLESAEEDFPSPVVQQAFARHAGTFSVQALLRTHPVHPNSDEGSR